VNYTVGFIAEVIGGKVIGNKNRIVKTISPPDDIKTGSIVFLRDKKYLNLIDLKVTPLCLTVDFNPEKIEGIDYIIIDPENKERSFIKLLSLFSNQKLKKNSISKKASISDNATLGNNVFIDDFVTIGENTFIGDETYIGSSSCIGGNCRIGKNCIIYQNVTIYANTVIKDCVILHAGAVIGSDGFGYSNIDGINKKVPQIGGVYLEKNVEIGANSTIDRATLGCTTIGENTKIDNLVHIAHNVKIGRNTVICALCGISGSVKIGDNVVIAGAVGIKDHVTVEDNVYIGAKAGVMDKIVKKGRKLLGIPAINFKSEMEFIALKPKIKRMYFDIKKINKRLGL